MGAIKTSCSIIVQLLNIFLLVTTQVGESVGNPAQGAIVCPSNLPVEIPINLKCPDPEEIVPCTCVSPLGLYMDIDCSKVQSEDQLKSLFSKEFPFTNFKVLTIDHNENLKALRAGDFGNSSFILIYLRYSTINEIEDLAFIGSQDTLTQWTIHDTKLESVPDISSFKTLTSLDVSHNALTAFPVLESPTLENLYLSSNQIENIPRDAISGLPSLNILTVSNISCSEILPETFTNNDNLWSLQLFQNNLTTLPIDAIALHGHGHLDLHDNQITHLPPGSFSGVTNVLQMNKNLLTELEEAVWRPPFEEAYAIYLEDNPFGCDCDIAWLITNRTLLERLSDEATCADGRRFIDLDPAYYEEEC